MRKRGVERERPDPLRKPCSPCSLLLPAPPTGPLPSGVVLKLPLTVAVLSEEVVEPGRRRRRRPSVLVMEGATVGEVHRNSEDPADPL